MSKDSGISLLKETFGDLASSRTVESACRKTPSAGALRRIERYLDRLSSLVDKEAQRGGADSASSRLEKLTLKHFCLDTSNTALVERIARNCFHSERSRMMDQGYGGDISYLKFDHVKDRYISLVEEKAELQRQSLKSWIGYLKKNEAKHPAWFRYLAVRELREMGALNRETACFRRRSASTLAPFPELNSEALGFVFKALSGSLDVEAYKFTEQQQELLCTKLSQKSFSGLYAFALCHLSVSNQRIAIDGEWRKYAKDSSPEALERDLKRRGTGWCTAEGSASAHLAKGDFYVFYTRDKDGYPSAPRIAIRMTNGKVAEIRGVEAHQELEPEMVEIAEEKGRTLPGFEAFTQATHDMKLLTRIYKRCLKKGEDDSPILIDSKLSDNELRFLLECERPIVSFGYKRDPRILELKNALITEIPPDIVFEGAADFSGCTAIRRIAPGTVFKGWANFRGCTGLSEISAGIIFKDVASFEECTGLRRIAEQVVFGFDSRFRGCTSLSALPKGLTVPGYADFRNCTALTEIPEGARFQGGANFDGCSSLTIINGNSTFDSNTYFSNCPSLRVVAESAVFTGTIYLSKTVSILSKGTMFPVEKWKSRIQYE